MQEDELRIVLLVMLNKYEENYEYYERTHSNRALPIVQVPRVVQTGIARRKIGQYIAFP
jgi:hypothetical protein